MTADTASAPGPVDPSEAPPGYTAVPYLSCTSCAYKPTCYRDLAPLKCTPRYRSDARNVMFAVASPHPAGAPAVAEDLKFIPSAGMCAECFKNTDDKCSNLPFASMEVLRRMPAHKIVVVRCSHFER